MNKFIHLLLSALLVVCFTGCGSEPIASAPDDDGQRSRAAKAQKELGTEVSKQRSVGGNY